MSYHLVAWQASVTNGVETDLTPVQDSIMAIQNGHFMPQVNTFIPFLYVGSANLSRARLITPKLRQVTTPFVRPIQGALLPPTLAQIADYSMNPLQVNGLEELQLMVFQGGGGAEVVYGVAGLQKGPMTPAPTGDIYTMRGTGTTTVTAKAWSQVSVTWQDTLPAGNYQVVGFSGVSTTGVAGRLVFDQQIDRPGGLLFATAALIEPRQFRRGYFGGWGLFTANRMPNVEFLCNAADTAQEIYLDLVRVG